MPFRSKVSKYKIFGGGKTAATATAATNAAPANAPANAPPGPAYEGVPTGGPEADAGPEAGLIAGSEDVVDQAKQQAQQLLNLKSKVIDGSAQDRAELFMAAFSKEDLTPKGAFQSGLAVCLKYFVRPLLWYIKCNVWMFTKAYGVWQILPTNVMQMVVGVGLCFFGGTFFATLAAMEAARQFGGQALVDELQICWEQAQIAAEASTADDKVDANNDNIPDVEQMKPGDLINHKAKVCMAAVEDPDRLMNAVQFLLSAWMSVIAVLSFQFAKYVAIALGLAEMVAPFITRIFGRFIAMLMGDELKHWVPTIVSIIVKMIAVVLVSYYACIREAFYAGLKGSQIFAIALINILGEKGCFDNMPAWVPKGMITQPFDANLSYIDEVIGYPLAAAGFCSQLFSGFSLVFPFNLILFPLLACEWILRWNIFT